MLCAQSKPTAKVTHSDELKPKEDGVVFLEQKKKELELVPAAYYTSTKKNCYETERRRSWITLFRSDKFWGKVGHYPIIGIIWSAELNDRWKSDFLLRLLGRRLTTKWKGKNSSNSSRSNSFTRMQKNIRVGHTHRCYLILLLLHSDGFLSTTNEELNYYVPSGVALPGSIKTYVTP